MEPDTLLMKCMKLSLCAVDGTGRRHLFSLKPAFAMTPKNTEDGEGNLPLEPFLPDRPAVRRNEQSRESRQCQVGMENGSITVQPGK